MLSRDVLIKPVQSEKAARLQSVGQYMFSVAKAASKLDIKKAIERHYGVHVVSIQTMMYRQSPRRQSKKRIENAGVFAKKAIIRLEAGQTMPVGQVGGTADGN